MAAGDGLISMTPSSITHSGTSASINADGGVDFTAVSSLSLNGVFTGDYDNYLIVISGTGSEALGVLFRLRASGSDATGSNYVSQELVGSGSSVSGARQTSQSSAAVTNFRNFSSIKTGANLYLYGTALAQPTAYRSVSVEPESSGAMILDNAGTHSLSTAYDGVTFVTNTGTVTGNLHVFGYEE
jgi:hypothetical protein